MSRPFVQIKYKRNNYTLSIKAQAVIDSVKNKSKFVSEAIINYEHKNKTNSN